MSNCHVCDAIEEAPDKPNTELADKVGTSEASIRRHRKANHNQAVLRDEFFEVPVEAITSRGASIRDPDTGSWQKISYSPHKAALIEASRTTYEDLNHVIAPYTPPPSQNTGQVLHVLMADPQIGKTGSNGGTPETLARVHSCLAQVVDHAKRHDYDEIVFADLGDSTEGFHNVTAQSQTNDLSLTDQVRTVRRLFMEAIRQLAPLAPRLTYVAVPSNHCSVRTAQGDKNRANAPDDDYGLLIQDSIEDAFSLLPTHNVAFKRPLKWEESVVHNGVGFTHGHLAKTPKNVAQWFKNQAAGKRSNLHEARILAYGHFHHLHMEETADAVLLLGAPALEGGSDYFTNSTGDRSNPGMLTFDTEDGHLKGWHVYRPTTEGE